MAVATISAKAIVVFAFFVYRLGCGAICAIEEVVLVAMSAFYKAFATHKVIEIAG